GKAETITRANLAAANLISDTQTFGTGNNILSGVGDYTLIFHSDLPGDDRDPLGADVTIDPALAAFAQVIVTPASVTMPFLSVSQALLGNNNGQISMSVSAEAVAGFTQEACDITPLMFCLPTPTYSAAEHVGDMIELRSGGQNAAYGPGDFGFLDPSGADLGSTCNGLTGVNLTACLIGADQNVTKCFTQRGVDTSPGQQVGIADALFNVRFDIYSGIMNGKKNNPNYAAAPDVIAGIVPKGGGNCIGGNGELSPDTMALPRDGCIISGGCGRFGNGIWDDAGYMTKNHPTSSAAIMAQLAPIQANPLRATRFEMYRAEIAYGNLSGPLGDILHYPNEKGRPKCNTYTAPSGINRRVVIAAGIDCDKNPVTGYTTNVPVVEFFELFLTQKVNTIGATSPPTLALNVEIIGSAGGTGYSSAGAGGLFRDVVQLYR
ncbi:MAG: TadE/TadG family type IV pilus assembly protein, partial [Paracoccaceae bacterium]